MSTKQTWRVGVLGTGRQAEQHRIPSLMALSDEGVDLVAVANRTAARARRVLKSLSAAGTYEKLRQQGYRIPDRTADSGALSVAVHGSLEEMIAEARLDGVLITVPHSAHADTTVAALDAGVHVLVEKPMATNPADGERMIAAAGRAGRVLTVGYQYPYMVDWARDVVASGGIGDVHGARVRWSRQDGVPEDPHFWSSTESGGVSLDLPGHLIAPLLPLLGDTPTSVRGVRRSDRGVELYGADFVAEDTMGATIAFSDGIRSGLEVSWAAGVPPEEELGLVIYGQRGTLEVPLIARALDAGAFRPVLRQEGDGGVSELGPPPPVYAECMVEQARNWVRACQAREPLRFTARDALAAERVVHAMRQSADLGGEWVSVEPG